MEKSDGLDYLRKANKEVLDTSSYIPPWNATTSYTSSPAVYYTASSLGAKTNA